MLITVIIPAYNEEISIEETIKKIKKIGDFEIIVVNDASKDRTGQIIRNIKGIKVINHPYNLGYGASLKDGLRIAKGEYILITDADGTYPIEDIPKLLKHIPHYDMVVGSRTGSNVNIPTIRKPAKLIIGLLANLMTKRKIKDINSGLRIFNREKALEFIKLYPSGFSFTTTITLAFFTNDYTVKYIPINYYKRKGKSTVRPKEFFNFITLIFRIIMYFKPIKFFLIPGLSLFLLGIYIGVYQILTSNSGIGDLPVLSIITGIQMIFVGFVADIISKKK